MRTEANLGFRAQKLAKKKFERPLEIGDRNLPIHDETLHLCELGKVGGIDLVAPIGSAGSNHAHRRSLRFHHANLDCRGVRPEQPAVGQIEGVQLVARRDDQVAC